ncbi:MAG: amylo-alpha-1,6-glucosidase, partial [Nitrososphaerales archaeon]
MTDGAIIVTSGSVFAISSHNGDINTGTTEGFYSSDTRFVSTFKLLVDGRTTVPVGVDRFDSSIVSFYSILQKGLNLPPSLSIVRDRSIDRGLHEDIYIKNDSTVAQSFKFEAVFAADFADVFEVRRGSIRKRGEVRAVIRKGQNVCFEYQRLRFHREVWISLSRAPTVKGNKVMLELTLAPKAIWKTCVNIVPVLGRKTPAGSRCVGTILGSPFGQFRRESSRFMHQKAGGKLLESTTLPELNTQNVGLRVAYYQAIYDLSSLELKILPKKYVLAAGLPWFMAVFGRDSIISAIQTKILGTSLLVNTIQTLATLQAKKVDKFSEAEPGKIPHEVRHGELSIFKEVPHSRYYGSVDATPLFVMLLWEAYQWTGDKEFLKEYIPAAESAIDWIDKYGDRDGDGFVEY